VKKILSLVLAVSFLIGLPFSAQAWGRRGQQTIGPTYHQQTSRLLPNPARALAFAGEQPVALATDDAIIFLSPSGQKISSRQNTQSCHLLASADGNFIAVVEIAAPDKSPQAPSPLTFTLYDRAGQKLWSLKQPVGQDDPLPSFYVSNKGRVVMMESAESLVSFFDQTGALDRNVRLFEDTFWSNERPVSGAFSGDGTHFAVNALHHHSRPGDELSPRQKGQSFVILFDDRGEELWRRELASEISDRVVISDDGMIIAAGAHSVKGLNVVEIRTYLYNDLGELLGQFDFPFQHAVFSSGGENLLLGQRNDLYLVEVSTGQVIWQTMLSSEAGQVRTLDLSADGRLALVLTASSSHQGDGFVFIAPQAFLFDHECHQLWSETFPNDAFWVPLATFLNDGARFLLAFQDRYLIYEPDDQ